jgi:hypothetical protein
LNPNRRAQHTRLFKDCITFFWRACWLAEEFTLD